jgi:hypothetical protein
MALHPSLPRTDWFAPDVDPTIPGDYECSVAANELGLVFVRRWNGTTWVSSVTFQPTTVRMFWRGVEPGASIALYPASMRAVLMPSKLVDMTDPIRAAASTALYNETMVTP